MASYRKVKLNDNSAFLQFNWKADVVESWIGRSKTFFYFYIFIAHDEKKGNDRKVGRSKE